MKNLWELWPAALPSEYCDHIISKSQERPAQEATIGLDPRAPPELKHRSSTIRWLEVEGRDSDIAQTLMSFIRRSNRNNFGFDITTMNEIQFTEYHGITNGKYDWHHDVFWENQMPFDRKLSIVVQLSHAMDYEGGNFEFFGMPSPGEDFKKRGSVLVFPAFFLHRVAPVTQGLRYSLVSWIEGPKFR